jgi:hypothetical protein
MNCDPRAMRDYASRVTALYGRELVVWRRPLLNPSRAPSTREPGEQRWEGEGGRMGTPAARS